MPLVGVARPVVRSFTLRFAREAAAHVRAGGHAVVWESPARALLVVRPPRQHDEEDLGLWSLLDLGLASGRRAQRGPLRGLTVARVPEDRLDIVRRRAERDSIHRGAVRSLRLDCTTCAACCRHNRVELTRRDLTRFARAARPELARPPFATRRSDGKLALRALYSGDCRHLRSDLRCGIYPIRPDACRAFPLGSEGCLFAREDELGAIDGATSSVSPAAQARRPASARPSGHPRPRRSR